MDLAIRPAVRALIVDSTERLLLFRGELPGRSPWWFAPGGADEAHETPEAALVREIAEETGLVVDPATLSPPVWTRDYLFRWKGVVERHLERFFLIRIETHEVDTTGFEAEEAGVIREHRWWTLGEIQSSTERFSPIRLADHLARLLDGRNPTGPVEVGE